MSAAMARRRAGQVGRPKPESASPRTLVVVSYDIRDDRRRARVAEILLGYGARIQASVYELWLDERALERLWAAVGRQVAAEDLVRCYVLCGTCVRRIRSYGMVGPEQELVFVV